MVEKKGRWKALIINPNEANPKPMPTNPEGIICLDFEAQEHELVHPASSSHNNGKDDCWNRHENARDGQLHTGRCPIAE